LNTLLIAGHGYLGQEVSRQARELTLPVVTLTRSGENADLACDLTDPAAISALASEIAPSHILACASSGRGNSEAYRHVFLNGTQNLIQAFPHSQLIFISSTSVYRQTDGSSVNEESATNGTTEKSAILLEAERTVLQSEGLALRLSGIYGPNRSVILKKFLAGESLIEETPEGLGVRIINQIHVSDAASAVLHLMNTQASGLYNVTDNIPSSQLETLQNLSQELDLAMPPSAPPKTTKRGWTHKAVSNQKLLSTGWTPQFPSFQKAVPTLLPTL